jgi:hypothetical protein
MSWSSLQLRKLAFLGPRKMAASLEFHRGVNVIYGASDTGKSFIVEALDYLLGSSSPLRDIPERVGYDRARLTIEQSGQEPFTIERSVEGGDFRIFEGLERETETGSEGTPLKAKHSPDKEDNLSGLLLSKIGLVGQRIRKNQKGETQSLSFRNLAKLVLVEEEEIIKKGSPFWTGQYIGKTPEFAVLKLLLTGLDDSALVPEADRDGVSRDASSKVELLDEWLEKLRAETEDISADPKELEAQLEGLEDAIESQRLGLQKLQQSLDHSMMQRRDILREREEVSGRIDEIEDLLSRFDLLKQHYMVDLERLAAIEESGSLFVHEKEVPCPLCGASPDAQHLDEACEGNVDVVVSAARAETEKITRLSVELQQTMIDLRSESKGLNGRLSEIEEVYRATDSLIRETISPKVGSVRASFSDLVEKRGDVKRIVEMFVQIDHLERQKSELLEVITPDQASEPSRTDLSKTVLDGLSQKVEEILNAWNFPGAKRVYFDEKAIDFVIDGKPRGSRGKGLRAITHAAVSIGLMEYCQDHDLPHPGFVVLDSPLLAYKEPEGQDDDLRGTDVKDRFYEYLASKHSEGQVIVMENEPPPESTTDSIFLTVFTKNPHQGRYGMFPYGHNEK